MRRFEVSPLAFGDTWERILSEVRLVQGLPVSLSLFINTIEENQSHGCCQTSDPNCSR